MFYRFIKAVVKPIFYFLYRIKVVHKENLKFEGQMILISNHRSNNDPIFLHLLVKPKVYFMAKSELFKNPFLRWIITAFGAFPVERGAGDLAAIKNAFKILRAGGILGIFPEGTRTRTNEIRRFQHGAAMIAIRTGAPVLPVYLSRTLRPFCKTYVMVGEPIRIEDVAQEAKLSDTEEIKRISNYYYAKMQELKIEAEALCK